MIKVMLLLVMLAVSVPTPAKEITEEQQTLLDRDKLMEIYIQQKEILKAQDDIKRKLETLTPYTEQVRINTQRLTTLETHQDRLEDFVTTMDNRHENAIESVNSRISAALVGTVLALLGLVGHFVWTQKRANGKI